MPAGSSFTLAATVTQPTAVGNLRLYPAGLATPPTVSTVNYSAAQTRGNNAIVQLGDLGQITAKCAQASGTTAHLVVDVNGYFQEGDR